MKLSNQIVLRAAKPVASIDLENPQEVSKLAARGRLLQFAEKYPHFFEYSFNKDSLEAMRQTREKIVAGVDMFLSNSFIDAMDRKVMSNATDEQRVQIATSLYDLVQEKPFDPKARVSAPFLIRESLMYPAGFNYAEQLGYENVLESQFTEINNVHAHHAALANISSVVCHAAQRMQKTVSEIVFASTDPQKAFSVLDATIGVQHLVALNNTGDQIASVGMMVSVPEEGNYQREILEISQYHLGLLSESKLLPELEPLVDILTQNEELFLVFLALKMKAGTPVPYDMETVFRIIKTSSTYQYAMGINEEKVQDPQVRN